MMKRQQFVGFILFNGNTIVLAASTKKNDEVQRYQFEAKLLIEFRD
jgi:hypothetical protein